MGEKQHQIIQLFWKGPFSLVEVRERKDRKNDVGLYQIYGQHVVFGPRSLLYVGMTDDQTFGSRFKQHADKWLGFEAGVEIRLGTLRDPVHRGLLKAAEALTIWWHSPPYNSSGIWRYSGDPIHVQNWHERGSLHPEYTSHWEETEVPTPEGEHP
jgi:hypothetical protein